MAQGAKTASFDDFLEAPDRLAKQTAASSKASSREEAPTKRSRASSPLPSKQSKRSTQKEKVGFTIDSEIIDAIEDYIYHERKQGHRLKKNDVYEAALRQFLGLEGGD